MLFFNVKRVLVTVAIIVGIMAVVIGGFLYAAGFFPLNKQAELYQGAISPQYLTVTAAAVTGEPIEEDTAEDLRDTDNVSGTIDRDAAAENAEGAGAVDTEDADTLGAEEADANAEDVVGNVKVLLFFGSGKIAARGNVSQGSVRFSLMKTVNMLDVSGPGDLPHMNRERDMLTNGEVETILADDGYFRIASGDKYISGNIRPAAPANID